MDRERWKQLDNLFQSALERSHGERDTYVRSACGGDHALEAELRDGLAPQPDGSDAVPAAPVGELPHVPRPYGPLIQRQPLASGPRGLWPHLAVISRPAHGVLHGSGGTPPLLAVISGAAR